MSSSNGTQSDHGSYFDSSSKTNPIVSKPPPSIQVAGQKYKRYERLSACTDTGTTWGHPHYIRANEKFLEGGPGKFCSSCATDKGYLDHELNAPSGGGKACSRCSAWPEDHAPYTYRYHGDTLCVSCATANQTTGGSSSR